MTSLGFAATPDGIRAAARQVAAAGEGARGLELGAVATTISQALSGAQSAAAASRLSTAWDSAISMWSADVAAHAQRLTGSATTYASNDVDSADRFRCTGPNRAS